MINLQLFRLYGFSVSSHFGIKYTLRFGKLTAPGCGEIYSLALPHYNFWKLFVLNELYAIGVAFSKISQMY